MVEIKEKSFFINGKREFLFGGEVHYFRIPKDQWEDRILKVKQAGGNLVSTYIPWIIHEDVKGDIDLVGKRRAENDLGHFLELIKKNDMYCMVRPGPYIMSEIRNEGLPHWIYDIKEDIVALNKKGEKHPSKSVYLLHEGFLGLVDNWYKALGDIIRPYMLENNGPVVMAQLDNEIGMMHWCSQTADYSIENIETFKQFLIKKYGKDLKNNYPELEFGQGFYDEVCNPREDYAKKLRLDLSLYTREYFKKYFEALKDKFNNYIGDVPVVVNVHGFDSVDVMKRGKQYPIGVAQLSRVADVEGAVMAGDYYIGNIVYDNFQDIMLANAFTSAVQNEEQPLFSAEFQGGFQVDTPRMQPPTYDLTTRICVANGMNSVNYYMFAGGTNVKGTDLLGLRHSWQAPVDTDGSLKPHYQTISHLGNIIKAAGETLLQTRQEYVVHLGLNPDYYMTEYPDEYSREICEELKSWRENFLYEGMGKGMSIMNIVYEGYDITTDKEIDINKIPKMAIFSTRYMDSTIQERIVSYIENGGEVVIFPTIPVMDMEGKGCAILKDKLGCSAEIHQWGFVKNIDNIENLIVGNATDFGDVQNVFATHEKDNFNCGFVKNIGKGKAIVFGVGMAHDYYYRDQVILNTFEKIGVRPLFTTSSIEDKLNIISRVNETGGRYLFINNLDEYDKTTQFYHEDKVLFGGKELFIRSRKGLMLPLNIQLTDDLYIKYSTAEIYEINEPENNLVEMKLALGQPQDEIVIKTSMVPKLDDSYNVSNLENGLIKITSNRHGFIEKYLTIEFKR